MNRKGKSRGASGARTRTVQVARYVEGFRCIGPECEDTCCGNWQLPIDRGTYQRYQRAVPVAFRDELLAGTTRAAGKAESEEAFAYFRYGSDGSCVFLTPERLCSIQQRAGEDYLCTTCFGYPREHAIVGDVVQRTLTLSCPEAARRALFEPNALDLVPHAEPLSVRLSGVSRILAGTFAADQPQRYTVRIRELLFDLLRRPDASLEARLLALGLALRKLQDTPAVSRKVVEETFESYAAALPQLEQQVVAIEPRGSFRLELLREVVVERVAQQNAGQGRYNSTVERMAQALGLRGDQLAGEAVMAAYNAAADTYYREYMEQRPYLLTNYILNQVLLTTFPFGVAGGMFEHYVWLLVRYALTKLHLVGMAAYAKGLTDELVVEVVQPLQRAIDHDPTFMGHIMELLRRNGMTTMAHMAVLIIA